MQYAELVENVQQHAKFEDEEAARAAVQATLETLGEVLPGGAADDLAAQLPRDLGEDVRRQAGSDTSAGDVDLEEFCRRVAEREGGSASSEDAREHARAVMTTLRDALTDGKFTDLVTHLPQGYGALFERS